MVGVRVERLLNSGCIFGGDFWCVVPCMFAYVKSRKFKGLIEVVSGVPFTLV